MRWAIINGDSLVLIGIAAGRGGGVGGGGGGSSVNAQMSMGGRL